MIDKHHFTFINKDASNIDAKEHLTAATSHAQSVTWSLRPRKTNTQKPKRPPSTKTFPSRNKDYGFAIIVPDPYVDDIDDDRVASQEPLADYRTLLVRKLSSNDPASDSVLHEQLDPFLSLAGPTDLYERNLLHYCMCCSYSLDCHLCRLLMQSQISSPPQRFCTELKANHSTAQYASEPQCSSNDAASGFNAFFFPQRCTD